MRASRLLAVAVLASLCASAPGCKPGECGEGTIEEQGVCVPASSITTPGECCGEGTHYDATQQACIADFAPTLCEENAPDSVVLDDGVIECCGCALYELCELTCQSARPGTFSVCGSVRDLATGAAVERAGCMSAQLCDPEEPDPEGSCALEPRFFDAEDLTANGASATPLAVDAIEWNACGAYAARSVAMPASGRVALVFDDGHAHDPPRDDFAPVAAVFSVTEAERLEGRDAFALRRDTDAAWSAAAGDPFGSDSFTAHGAELVRFLRGSDPVVGVAVTDDGGQPLASAYYFSDDRDVYATVAPAQTATGANGAVLLAPDTAALVYAEGGLPAECAWEEELTEAVPGFLLVVERTAVLVSSNEVCP